MSDIYETCGCGATIRADSSITVAQWRREHRCNQPIAPGPCDQTAVTGEGCTLLAGHAGFHIGPTDIRTGSHATWGLRRWTATPMPTPHGEALRAGEGTS